MRGRRRRVGITGAIAVLLVSACGAEHVAPEVASPFDEPAMQGAGQHRPVGARRDDGGTTDQSDPQETATTADAVAPTASAETAPATTAPSTATDPAAWAVFDEKLSGRLMGSGDYAVGVAVAVDGEIVHTAEFGNRVPPPITLPADPTTTVPGSSVTTTTVPGPPPEPIEAGDRFRIASISKVITAIVVLQLVEAGQLGLDEPVGTRLAELVGATVADPQVAAVTVRQLLSHTSGFPEYDGAFFRGGVESCSAAGQYGLSRPLNAVPGTQYTYSNLNYCLLGLLVEQVAGRQYDAVVADRLLTPLGISGMRLASTYDDDPAQVVHPSVQSRNYMEVLGGAGAWVATASDVVKILASLDVANPGFHPLDAGLVELMRTPVLTAARPDPTRGYGLGMIAFGDGTFGHTGTIENTHAMVVDRPDGVTWAVLVSGEYPGNTDHLASIFDRSIADAGVTLR